MVVDAISKNVKLINLRKSPIQDEYIGNIWKKFRQEILAKKVKGEKSVIVKEGKRDFVNEIFRILCTPMWSSWSWQMRKHTHRY